VKQRTGVLGLIATLAPAGSVTSKRTACPAQALPTGAATVRA